MKKVLALFLVFVLCFSFCSCSKLNRLNFKIAGRWTIVDLEVEPEARGQYLYDDDIKTLSEAFPSVDDTIRFTKTEYRDGYKLISDSATIEYCILSDSEISVGSNVGEYDLSGDILTITFEDIATITLEKK